MKDNPETIIPDFSDLNLVVIGDIMIDRYIYGSVRRVSPEAPVPVVEMTTIENRLGGAGNVALNLLALGANVTLISICGDDDERDNLLQLCFDQPKLRHHILKIEGRKTTTKSRVMAGNQHLLRIDSEDKVDLDKDLYDQIFAYFKNLCVSNHIHGLVLQDYNKGLMSAYLIKVLLQYCHQNHIATFVDPKEKNFFSYTGCTVFKPNKKEAQTALGDYSGDYKTLAQAIQARLESEIVILTLGSQGIYIYDKGEGCLYPTSPRIIADVCGAGDAVISIVALSFLKKMTTTDMARLANLAGGQVCEIPGVAVIDKSKLLLEWNTKN